MVAVVSTTKSGVLYGRRPLVGRVRVVVFSLQMEVFSMYFPPFCGRYPLKVSPAVLAHTQRLL